eukprot:1157415-Pelagomonas_calceolata.AAC.6
MGPSRGQAATGCANSPTWIQNQACTHPTHTLTSLIFQPRLPTNISSESAQFSLLPCTNSHLLSFPVKVAITQICLLLLALGTASCCWWRRGGDGLCISIEHACRLSSHALQQKPSLLALGTASRCWWRRGCDGLRISIEHACRSSSHALQQKPSLPALGATGCRWWRRHGSGLRAQINHACSSFLCVPQEPSFACPRGGWSLFVEEGWQWLAGSRMHGS